MLMLFALWNLKSLNYEVAFWNLKSLNYEVVLIAFPNNTDLGV